VDLHFPDFFENMNIKVKHKKVRGSNQSEDRVAKPDKSWINQDEEIFKQCEKEMRDATKKFQYATYHKSLKKIYNDGDQSPVKGRDAKKINYKWRKNLTWDPDGPFASAWMRACAYGDLVKMQRNLQFPDIVTTCKTAAQLIEERETLLNFSAILHVVKGATHKRTKWYNIKWALSGISMTLLLLAYFTGYMGGYVMTTIISPFITNMTHYIAHKPKHRECLRELLDNEADVNAKDFAGCTALFYCVGENSNSQTIKLADMLLMAGARVNTRNRQGATALRYAVEAGNINSIEFLLEVGADPTIVDHDGVSMSYTTDNAIREVFQRFRKKRIIQTRMEDTSSDEDTDSDEEESLSNLVCKYCKSSRKLSRCSSCFLTRYCGSECQRKDWKNHENKCLDISCQFKAVRVTLHGSHNEKDIHRTGSKKNFVVKISIQKKTVPDLLRNYWFDYWFPLTNALIIHNKKKNLDAMIKFSEPSYTEILNKIQVENWMNGSHGFFYAFFDTNDELHVNTKQLLPEEAW